MKDNSTLYDQDFYLNKNRHSMQSAQVIVPMIIDLLKPKSVIDVGCGRGEWLTQFAIHNIDIQGIDGPYIADSQLLIPGDKFARHDLTKPMTITRQYDLAISLEVAEHLPRNTSRGFAKLLSSMSPAVVFSAALPLQGGVNHINEQWPWYWKKIFHDLGYVRLDPFRKYLWQRQDVAFYYQQNIYLFVDPTVHQPLIDHVGIPDKYNEMTIIKTTILEDVTKAGKARKVWDKLFRRDN